MSEDPKPHKQAYALVELNFILHDPTYYTLSAPAKAFYISLWCLAVSERSELVRRPSASYIAILASSYAPHSAKIVQELMDAKLLVAFCKPAKNPDEYLMAGGERLMTTGKCIETCDECLVSIGKPVVGFGEWLVIFGVSKKHNKINITKFSDSLKNALELNGIGLNGMEPKRSKVKHLAPVKPERELTPIQDFVNFYSLEYEKRFGKKYLPDWGKDGSHIKRALKVLTMEDLKNLLPEFFDDPLDWQGDKPNRTIALFISILNRYGNNNQKISAGTRKLLGGIAEWYEKTKHLDEGVKHDS